MNATRDQGWLLGIEIGGTKLQLGIGRGDGSIRVLERRKVDPARGAGGILDQIDEALGVLLARTGLRAEDLRALGVGFGGPVDSSAGSVRTSYQVEGWSDFPLAERLRQSTGIARAVVENDADTAGLAEAIFGAGAGCSPLLYLTIGSGIGGALIIEQQIYRGCGVGAVEIGHTEVPLGAGADVQIVPLEDAASGWGIARQARRQAIAPGTESKGHWVVLEAAGADPGAITTEMVAEAAFAGDERAAAILDAARRSLAFALRQAIALCSPRRIILGGGVSLIGEAHWFGPIRALVDASVFPPFRGTFDIVPAALGEQVVVHGALALADRARPESD